MFVTRFLQSDRIALNCTEWTQRGHLLFHTFCVCPIVNFCVCFLLAACPVSPLRRHRLLWTGAGFALISVIWAGALALGTEANTATRQIPPLLLQVLSLIPLNREQFLLF